MNKTVVILISVAGIAFLSGCNQQNQTAPAAPPMATNAPSATMAPSDDDAALVKSDPTARESYAVGMYMGHGWKTHDVNLDLDLVFRGIRDSESNAPMLLTDEEMTSALKQLQQSIMMARQKMSQEEGESNLQEGETFLAQNKNQPGVVTLPDGLQYKIIKDGTGPSPGPNDSVVVNYTGKFVNGTVFDSSERQGPPSRPAVFPVRAVIPGWTEGLEKMKVGSQWELYIPYTLAYGPPGRPPMIGPNKALIFDVELMAIKPGSPPPPPPQPLTSDIIKVPSAEEMQKGAQIETIKASDLQKMQQSSTNQ
jgi:FKBP-type peptidyl-prolyl cis-trans isomerase